MKMPPGTRKFRLVDFAALLLAGTSIFGCSEGARRTETQARSDASVPAQPSAPEADAGGRALDASLPPALDAGATHYSSLVDMDDWHRYDAALDPLKAHQPDVIECYPSATYVEYGSFEVDTTRCNYTLAYTPALRAVPAGTTLRLNMLHYDLLAPMPAEAHIALIFNDSVQWEETIPIPAPGGAVDTTFVSSVPLAFQDPIRLHLHNHGGNTYLLVSLEAPDLP